VTAKEEEGGHDREDLELGFSKEWEGFEEVNVASAKGKDWMEFGSNKLLHKEAHNTANP